MEKFEFSNRFPSNCFGGENDRLIDKFFPQNYLFSANFYTYVKLAKNWIFVRNNTSLKYFGS